MSTKLLYLYLKFSCTVMFEFYNSLFDMKSATEDVVEGVKRAQSAYESLL